MSFRLFDHLCIREPATCVWNMCKCGTISNIIDISFKNILISILAQSVNTIIATDCCPGSRSASIKKTPSDNVKPSFPTIVRNSNIPHRCVHTITSIMREFQWEGLCRVNICWNSENRNDPECYPP